ncbi:MAG: glycosyltransferase [Patescibacteria group bacterium]|nr:glycosyltransferase [Patescibacteria group bacterium]
MNQNQKLNILMFNMSKYSDWQKGVVNRNFHILHNLAKRDEINKIIAVDFLPFNWKRAIKTFIYDQILKDTRGTICFGDLTSQCWQISSKILVYSTIDSILNKKRIITELKRILDKEGMNNNLIVWNYNPMYIDYFNQFKQRLNIFDTVDNWLEHSSYQEYKNLLQKNYDTIKDGSDLIFTVSENLKQNLFNNQESAHWIPNAVDLDYFQNQTNISPKLQNIPKPIIGFLGILQDRIDLEILLNLAKNNPEKSLILAGPVWKNFPREKFNGLKNVYFLGPIGYSEIPSLYNGFDVGIIPYKINAFIKSTDPMKYYEYLAANLPVVSTPAPGIERFGNLIKVAKTPEEFNVMVNQALSEGKDRQREERIKILQNNTWGDRIEEMLKLINARWST